MTLAELKSTTIVARWRSLSADQQEAIGAKVLAWVSGELVADDDGTDTTEADRDEARTISDDAFSGVDKAVMAAFPGVLWFWPGGVRYVVYDRHGRTIGEIVDAEPTGAALNAHRFAPTDPDQETGPAVNGLPTECLPPWVLSEIEPGGRWGAVLPQPKRPPPEPISSNRVRPPWPPAPTPLPRPNSTTSPTPPSPT